MGTGKSVARGAGALLPFVRHTAKRCGLAVYWVILKLLSLLDRRGPSPFLTGNFAPVHDERLETVEVEGRLPPALDGAFLRVGPNPVLPPLAGYHLFDGDGMAHAVTLDPSQPSAHYCCHQIRTARLRIEAEAGWPVFPKLGDYFGLRGLAVLLLHNVARALGLVDASQGGGCANTALVFHAKKLLALHEGDLPYVLELARPEGALRTLGRLDFGGRMEHPFTAHPKVCPQTQECFFFGYGIRAPYCWFGRLSAEGELVADFPVPLPEPVMMHDMGLTAKHIIVLDLPLVFKPELMVRERSLPFTFTKERAARFGVLPRDATSADGIRWFSTEALMAFHVANVWEEGSTIRLLLCCFKNFTLHLDEYASASEAELPRLTEVTLDLETGAASVRTVCDVPGDFPQVHPSLLGRKARFVYLAAFVSGSSKAQLEFSRVVKVDLEAATPEQALVGAVEYGPGCTGGEAVFVPSGKQGAAEDDGYLLSFVHDKDTDLSQLAAYDARTMSSMPIARVPLRSRVPSGFHAHWVPAAKLAEQTGQL